MLSGAYVASKAYIAVDKLLAQGDTFDALVAANDAMAYGAVLALEARGYNVPDDVVVSGFDDSEIAFNASVPLSTVRSSSVNLMRCASELLLDQLESVTVTQHVRLRGEAMEELSMSRAFLLRFERDKEDGEQLARLVCAYPSRDACAATDYYSANRLLPAAFRDELARGTLVLTEVAVDDELIGALVFDPSGFGRSFMLGLAQSVFSALRHHEQRERLEAQAKRLEQANAQLMSMTDSDSLTGLANRARLREKLNSAIQAATAPLVVLYFDLDGFKKVNDTLGHDAGDRLLKIVGARVKASVRERDVVARLGGDEFVVVLMDVDRDEGAQAIADQLLAEISRPMRLARDQTVKLTASIGLSSFPSDGNSVDALLRHADTAMYKAKSEGRNRAVWFNRELSRLAREQRQLESAMREGFERGEFRLQFQPRFDSGSYSIIGLEALLRWTSADGSEISPEDFIPIAEQTGFVRTLDTFALNMACAHASDWRRQGHQCRVSVNLSASRLQQSDVVEEVSAVLARHKVPGHFIEFEMANCSETLELPGVVEAIVAFRAMGIGLTIDQFGKAGASLDCVSSLPIDCLKLLLSRPCYQGQANPDWRQQLFLPLLNQRLH